MLLSNPVSSHHPTPARPRRNPPPPRRSTAGSIIRFSLEPHNATPILFSHGSTHPLPILSNSSALSPVPNLGLRRSPELGLCSLLFVFSMALGSIFSLAVISLPALSAFRRLAVSMDKLSKVASEEVPGTLSSLKLSGLEINDLTSQLTKLREIISGNKYGKKARRRKPSSRGGSSSSITN